MLELTGVVLIQWITYHRSRMKILFWNIRGLGNVGRRKLLLELVNKHSFDCICLQETIKTSFRQRELEKLLAKKIWPGPGCHALDTQVVCLWAWIKIWLQLQLKMWAISTLF
jgi:hypothetical protein